MTNNQDATSGLNLVTASVDDHLGTLAIAIDRIMIGSSAMEVIEMFGGQWSL
jgi:hypothetical protein